MYASTCNIFSTCYMNMQDKYVNMQDNMATCKTVKDVLRDF